jgi:hypothetical protein
VTECSFVHLLAVAMGSRTERVLAALESRGRSKASSTVSALNLGAFVAGFMVMMAVALPANYLPS